MSASLRVWRGCVIRKILHSRLPERLADRVPRLVPEIGIGIGLAALVVVIRLGLQPLVGELAPFTFVTLGMVAACFLAGWRSGLVALGIGQVLTWHFIIEPRFSWQIADSTRVAGFVVATCAQLLILLVVAVYQREVARGMRERERRLELLHHALNEIDHRTRNNYQTVIALVLLQARQAKTPEVASALAEVADRIRAVSLASDHLARRSPDLGTIRLGDHLRELCEQLRRALTSERVRISCDLADVTAKADTAIHLSIIVNELVTNAVKHAFNGHGGEIRVSCAPAGRGLELVVADNGLGMKSEAGRRQGLGTRLVERFVQEMKASHEVVTTEGGGTTHRILVEQID